MTTSGPLTFDRASGRLEGAALLERCVAFALAAGARLSAALAYHGYAVGCRIVCSVLREEREIIVRLNPDALFAFPFGDGYWSFLLDPRWVYEEEIELFLASIADVDYTFLDCGANFGFWSVLVASAPFGRKRCLAIEASAANAAWLKRNAEINGGRFEVLHRALGAHGGEHAYVSGHKHEALQVTAGDDDRQGEPVDTVSLDELLAQGRLSPTGRNVVKLDVEGAEIDSFRGARRLLEGDAVVICEEHGADRNHTVSRFILNETPCRLFVHDPARGRIERCTDLGLLDRIKKSRNKGYNVFATASTFWEERLLAAASTGAPAVRASALPVGPKAQPAR